MTSKPALHFIDSSTRSRAEFARLSFGIGHHCEVYGDIGELADHPPRSGIIVARDGEGATSASSILELLGKVGIWQPLVAVGEKMQSQRIVEAIKAGALDYLALPLDPQRLERCLARISGEAEVYSDARRRMIQARDRIANLSSARARGAGLACAWQRQQGDRA